MVPHGSFPGDCSVCHLPERWDLLREGFEFDHAEETGHELNGAHKDAACLLCHNDLGPVNAYAERGCGGCHNDPHKSTLGMLCTDCHQEDTWDPVGLVLEHARTRLPLVGAHAVAPCESCHERATVGEFRDTSPECHFCHRRDVVRAFPNHVINGWVRDCENCHTPMDWSTRGFDHSRFPLEGGHAGLDCTQCHANGQFTPLSPECFACHQNDYVQAPDHVAEQRSTDCTECHDTVDWNNASD
jgi:hypothetical protein